MRKKDRDDAAAQKGQQNLTDRELLLREASKIVEALAKTFAPMCEVVLHDLSKPEHTIVQIENNQSGRSVGGPATEIGLARISDPSFPDVVANYANTFADGRPVKCTSIGLKDRQGNFVAAICINTDVSYMRSFSYFLNEFTAATPLSGGIRETLGAKQQVSLEETVRTFASTRNKDPRALTTEEKRDLVHLLAESGGLGRRGAVEQLSGLLGGSRSSIYYYLKLEADSLGAKT